MLLFDRLRLRFLYNQDLVATGVVRLRKSTSKDNLADLPVERLRNLCELRYVRPSTVYYNIHSAILHDYHAQLAHHHLMNMLHDYLTTHVKQCSATYYHLSPSKAS